MRTGNGSGESGSADGELADVIELVGANDGLYVVLLAVGINDNGMISAGKGCPCADSLSVGSVNTDLAVFCMEADWANIPRENAKVKMMMIDFFIVDIGLSCFVM